MNAVTVVGSFLKDNEISDYCDLPSFQKTR